jgi:5-methylcytosine-specific restriction endonuclease McrA
MTGPKRCPRCDSTKPASEFYISPLRFDGLSGHCRKCVCARISNRYRSDPTHVLQRAYEWRRKNQDRHRETSRKWYRENSNKRLLKIREWQNQNLEKKRLIDRKWARNNPSALLEKNHRRRARINGNTTSNCRDKEQKLRLASFCYWCGGLLTRKTFSIDHIVPIARGGQHRPENLVAACRRCNFSKGKKSPEEWAAAKR